MSSNPIISRYRYRVNGTAPLSMAMQVSDHTANHSKPPLNCRHAIARQLLEPIIPDDGIVYITGATGSGKSTLLASIIRHIAEDPDCHRKILTYESPIEFVFDEIERVSSLISQSEIPLHLPSFAAGVRNALRRKPRLILVGEARDSETISAALEAALTGPPVYTTLHTNGVPETIRRLVGSFPPDERRGRTIDIIETLRVIIWQRLVPTTDGKRTPLREYLVFDDQIRNDLLTVDPERVTEQTRKVLYKHGQTMFDDAHAKFKDGIIEAKIFKGIERAEAFKKQFLEQ